MTVMIAEPETLHYLSFDPGGSTGWAAWDSEGCLLGYGTAVGEPALYDFLFKYRAKHYIVEKWMLYPHKNQKAEFSWNEFDTSQRIGAIKFVAFLQGAPVTEQQASIKKIAYMQAGVDQKRPKREEHQWDAIIHGFYFLMKTGIRKPGPLFPAF